MVERDTVSNMALSRDARTFDRVVQVPVPNEGEVLWVLPYAEYPFTIQRIHYWVDGGELEIVPQIDGIPIDTDDTDSTGIITVDQPTRQSTEPDGDEDNYTVNEGQSLALACMNVSSNANGLVVQFTCRRTEEKVFRSE